MVKALHGAGLEVILDVVFNHSAEGDLDGPCLPFRGFDNASYYRLDPNDPTRYADYTGTGNTLAAGQPEVLRLVMSSLRYWVTDMHVDGFRFDLASVLARQLIDVDRLSAFLDLVYQDPVVSQVKLIAEPWDLAAGGYQLGHFPWPWSEWNDRFRGGVRDFWRSSTGIGELATRLGGSSDVFQPAGLAPQASINFVTAHDGFTLADLVAYNGKHNEANGEGGRDGTDDNRSWNCGVEGLTTDGTILALRSRQQRNLLATLLLSTGVPMLLGGDEIGRTQQGNNNAYCQDGPMSWYDWNLDAPRTSLLAFCRRVVALRRAHPGLRRRSYFTGQEPRPGVGPDVVWLGHNGQSLDDAGWNSGLAALGMWLNGNALTDIDTKGGLVGDDVMLFLINGTPDSSALPYPPPPSAPPGLLCSTPPPLTAPRRLARPRLQPARTLDFLVATSSFCAGPDSSPSSARHS
jgi:isoamylase